MQAELSTFLSGINLGLSRGRQELEILHQTSQSNAKDRQGKNDSRATPPPNSEWKIPEIIAICLNLRLLLQESFGPVLFRVLPVGRVVGEPPSIHQYLALSRDVIAAELRLMEVHVGDKERDCHAETERFLDHGIKVRQLLHFGLSYLDARSEHCVKLFP